jgi:hypothetical protein
MSYYVEYLRATRALRIVVILLGIVLLGALVLRLSWGAPTRQAGPPHDYYADIEHSPTAHVSVTRLPNGDTRTIVEDRVKAHYMVIERKGKDVVGVSEFHTKEAYEYAQRHPTPTPRVRAMGGGEAGDVGFSYSTSTPHAAFEIGNLLSFTLPMGLLVATLLAGVLSKENNGHLELVWTKPVSREAYALTAALVDGLTLVVAQLATAVAFVIAGSFWGWPTIVVEPEAAGRIAVALLGPIAWYACLTAFSASLKRGPGIVLGLGWVLAFVCAQVASSTRDATTAVGRAVHAIFGSVNYIDPIAYAWGLFDYSDPARHTQVELLALAVLAVVYLGLALLQWRRLEA